MSYEEQPRTVVPGIWSDVLDNQFRQGYGNLRTRPKGDFFLDISAGEVDGYGTQFKFGRNPSVGITEEVVWDNGGGYTFLTSAESMLLSSDSTEDNPSGGGAWNVVLTGLDSDFNEVTEVVVLDGTNAVETSNSFIRVYRAFVLQSGLALAVDDANLGTISVISSVSDVLQAQIRPNNGQTLMCVYTVPNGKVGYVTGLSLNVGQGKQCLFRAKVRNCSTENCCFTTKYAIDIYQNSYFGELKTPLRLPPKTDVVITAQMSSTPDATASASFGLILIDEDL